MTVMRARQEPGITPGTGKSHTIANLISHYVAEGKRVLVTAEKEQALKVLAEEVPEEIRDLTVSVLCADEDGRKRLGDSIRSIQTKVGLVDRRIADERIAALIATIDRLDRRHGELIGQLRASRWAEFEHLPGHWVAGEQVTPQVAAGWLHDHPKLDYVPDPVAPGTECPLTSAELAELVGSLRTIEPVDARDAVLDQPPVSDLPSARDLQALFDEGQDIGVSAARARVVTRGAVPAGDDVGEKAQALAADSREEARWRQSIDGTWVAKVVAQTADPRLDTEWVELAHALNQLRDQIFDLRQRLRAHDVRLPATQPIDFETRLREAAERLGSGRKLGLFQREARGAVDACRVDGRAPTTADQVRLCLDALTIEQLRHQLANRWYNQTRDIGAPMLDGLPEEAVAARLQSLAEVRRTAGRWSDLATRAVALGLPVPPIEPAALDGFADLAADLAALVRRTEIDTRLADLRGRLARISGPGVGGKFTGPPERFWGRHALPSGSFQRSRIQAVVANHLLNNRLVIHQV